MTLLHLIPYLTCIITIHVPHLVRGGGGGGGQEEEEKGEEQEEDGGKQ